MARVPEASVEPRFRGRKGLPPLIFLPLESFPTLHYPNIPARSPTLQAKYDGAGSPNPEEAQDSWARGVFRRPSFFFPGPRPDFRFLNNALQPKYHQAGSVNPHEAQVP